MNTDIVSIDFETRSATDIKLGVERYSKDPECEVLMLAYRMPDDAEPVVWHRGPHLTDNEATPAPLLEHVARGGRIRAWNAMFEWHIWNHVCVPKYGWPELKLEQCVDTMAQAAAQNLPQALGRCAVAMGLPSDKQKDTRGKYLIQRLCVPHPPTKTRAGKWVEDAELFNEMVAYCAQDVIVEEAIARKLRPLSPFEQDVWIATQRVNLRGVPVALDEARNIHEIVELEKERLNRELRRVTGRRVLKATDRNGLLEWVNEQGLAAPVDFVDPVDNEEDRPGHEEQLWDLRGDTVEAVLKRDDLTPGVRRALEIRAAVVQTSTAKYAKLLKITADDGTIKNMFVYHGAGTGRWASRGGFNVQNITRPTLLVNEKLGLDDIANAHEILGSGRHDDALLMWGDRTMDAAVSCLRGVLKAPPGFEFIDADYSSVENRVGVWLAGQDDKVAMFAKGLDEYKVFASKSLYGVPYDQVTKDMRQMSKSAVLGCFAGDTQVLTRRGFVPIFQVRDNDQIWDGEDFVSHGGVVFQGVKEVIDLAGVGVTPDHQILQESGWERADTVDLKSAIRLAGGLSRATSLTGKRLQRVFDVLAGLSGLFRSTTCEEARRPLVGGVRTETLIKFSEIEQGSQTSFPTLAFVSVGSTAALQPYLAATTLQTASTKITAGEVSTFVKSGLRILLSFCVGSWDSLAGKTQVSRSTARTTTGLTPRATAGLQPGGSSAPTRASPIEFGGKAGSCQAPISGESSAPGTGPQESFCASSERANTLSRSLPRKPVAVVPTYDIVNCGPRNRFAIRTNAGLVIAHNCLFGQGANGLIEYAKGYGVTLTPERSKEVVDAYRAEYAEVKALWYACGDAAINAVRNPGQWFEAGDKLSLICHRNFLWMKLPSGRLISWSRPEVEMQEAPWKEKVFTREVDQDGNQVVAEMPVMRPVVTVESIDTYTRQFCRHKLIGSSIFQSAVQGTARDIIAQGLMNVEAEGYPVVLMAHDELMALVPEGARDADEFGRLMCKPAEWFQDLPLSYEAWRGKRFKK